MWKEKEEDVVVSPDSHASCEVECKPDEVMEYPHFAITRTHDIDLLVKTSKALQKKTCPRQPDLEYYQEEPALLF